jgi:hypothetical protein
MGREQKSKEQNQRCLVLCTVFGHKRALIYALKGKWNMRSGTCASLALSIFIVSITMAKPSAAAEPLDYNSLHKSLVVSEHCKDMLDKAINEALVAQPAFTDIKQMVTWTRLHLPSDLQEAFNIAAKDAIREAKPRSITEMATNQKAFKQLLYRVTAEHLEDIKQYKDAGCSIATPDIVENDLYLTLHLSKPTMSKQFNNSGIDDSYNIQRAFLLMLTLDSSGVPWDVTWFSGSY